MTFTPPSLRPILDASGNLQWDQRSNLITVPTGEFTSFEPRHELYVKIAEVVTTLAAASLVFIPNSRLSIYPHSCAFALVMLGFSVLYSVGFMAVLTYFYEGFLYDATSDSPRKYALVHAFGFGGMICFALAYFPIAIRFAWSLMYSATPFGLPRIGV